MSEKKTKLLQFKAEPELKEILKIDAGHRGVRLGTAIRQILWEYINHYRKTSICDVEFYLKQAFPEKDLTDEQIGEAVKFVLKINRVDDNLELNQDEINKVKFAIDIGVVDGGKPGQFFCEICNTIMVETSMEELGDRTHGLVGDGSHVCFGCAQKNRIMSWVRLGADRDERYPGLE